jgi:hypothetical protein
MSEQVCAKTPAELGWQMYILRPSVSLGPKAK